MLASTIVPPPAERFGPLAHAGNAIMAGRAGWWGGLRFGCALPGGGERGQPHAVIFNLKGNSVFAARQAQRDLVRVGVPFDVGQRFGSDAIERLADGRADLAQVVRHLIADAKARALAA